MNELKDDPAFWLYSAADRGDLNKCRELLASGVDVNSSTESGGTALHAAAASAQTEVATLLLDHGANVNAVDNFDRSPLHWAVINETDDHEHANTIQVLIDHGASLDWQCDHGWTALHHAAAEDNERTVQMMLDAGANPHVAGKDGKRASDLAQEQVYPELREKLAVAERRHSLQQIATAHRSDVEVARPPSRSSGLMM